MMVRNEADIVEASVRHNLSLLDGLYVAHHRSVDGTGAILAALRREGLPLAIGEDPAAAFVQWRTMTALARAAFREGADFVFPLDADEFLRTPSRAVLERTLASIPPDMHAVVDIRTFVPVPPCAGDAPVSPAAVRRRVASERLRNFHVVVSAVFAGRPSEAIADGSHRVADLADETRSQPYARLSPDAVTIAHLPVRSANQIAAKAVVGWLAHRAANRGNPDMAYHWRDLYEDVCAGRPFDAQRIAEIAANYGLPRDQWLPPGDVPLVDDAPLPDVPLRYGQLATLQPLAVVARFAEELVRDGTAPAPAAPAPAPEP
jgi:hypothetical protein